MDTKIKRYFALRKLERQAPRPHTSASFNHDSASVFTTETTRHLFGFGRDTPSIFRRTEVDDGLQASPYEATRQGKLPIFVGSPVPGNGPVKLGTSRRLATGELIQTQQDHQRTLEDIRHGQYIVGRKETRRSPSQANQQLMRRRISKEDIKHSDVLPRIPSPVQELPAFQRDPRISPPPPDRGRRSRSSSRTHRPSQLPPPIPRRSISASPSRASVLTSGAAEEQNFAIEALWKAENTRLASLFTPGETEQGLGGLRIQSAYAPPMRPDSSRTSSSQRGSRGQRESDASFLPYPPMIPCSANNSPRLGMSPSVSDSASIWSNDQRAGMRSPDPNASRGDVRNMIENMRSSYLTALETKDTHSGRHPTTRKRASSRVSQASYQRSPSNNEIRVPKVRRSSSRRSWHAGNNESEDEAQGLSAAQKNQVIRKQKSVQHVAISRYHSTHFPPPPGEAPTAKLPPVPPSFEDEVPDSPIDIVLPDLMDEHASESDESNEKPALARADSLTLGSLLNTTIGDKPRSKKSANRRSHEQQHEHRVFSKAPSEMTEDSGRDSLPSSISTTDFYPSIPSNPSESFPRPATTSTIATMCSSHTANTTSTTSTTPASDLTSMPIAEDSSLDVPTDGPAIVPQTYIYNPDDSFDNTFNFDVFFYDNNGIDGGVLRTIRHKKPSSKPKPPPKSTLDTHMPRVINFSTPGLKTTSPSRTAPRSMPMKAGVYRA